MKRAQVLLLENWERLVGAADPLFATLVAEMAEEVERKTDENGSVTLTRSVDLLEVDRRGRVQIP